MTALSVGVVIPARNAARYIAEAIDSVLAQEGARPELVVVDDGSDDETPTIVAAYGAPVRLLRQQPLGPAAARNAGVRSLQTDLVAFLDADDLWPLDSLSARLQALADDPAAELVFGHMVQFIDERLSEAEQRRLHCDPRPQPAWASSAMLARRAALDRVGPLPEHRRAGDFLEWLLLSRRAGVRALMLDQVVLRRRLHDRNLTRLEPETSSHYLAVVRAELARRRAARNPGSPAEQRD
jgi:glycosyltransferase involved in cell wall biosynthesis